MARKGGSQGIRHTSRQKGYSRKGGVIGTYARKKKSKYADRYDRPALTRNYSA